MRALRIAAAPLIGVLIVLGGIAANELRQIVDRAAIAEAVSVVGPEEVVFDWSEQACEPNDIPDVPARAFRDANGNVQLIASHHVTRRMVGPNLNALTRDCAVLMTSHEAPDPARFDGREWIHAVYTTDGVNVFALVHNEYQGHRVPGRCLTGEYTKCWYNAITLAVSRDGGSSYSHAAPPAHVVASIPYPYEPDAGPIGSFNPSNIVRNPHDGFYYVLFHVEGRGAQRTGTCVMRTADLADPTAWRAWDGRGFSIQFVNPYRDTTVASQSHVCQPVARDAIQTMSESLTFNTYFDRFLLVGLAPADVPGSDGRSWGVYYSLSDDLVNWTPRRLILPVETPWSYTCGDPDPIAYPSVLDPASPSRSFDTSGQRVYLYFTRFNFEDCRQTLDRDLVRVPIAFGQ